MSNLTVVLFQGKAVVEGWKVGDKLEALDLHDTEHDLAYVATVSNVMEVDPTDPNLILIVLLLIGSSADPL